MADVFAQAIPLIEDERLREEVKGFVGQEATHARSHETFREQLAQGGVDVARIVAIIEYVVGQVFGDHGLTGRAKQEWLAERLGIYAAAEHFTAVVGEWLIENENFERAGMDPTMLDLLRWHCAEEMEHRNVAFDAYQHVDGSYARRVRTALIASMGLAGPWMLTSSTLYRNDPAVTKRSPWAWELIKGTRRGLIPGVGFFCGQMPQYLNPNFHPSQMGDIDTAVRYLARSPAALAAR